MEYSKPVRKMLVWFYFLLLLTAGIQAVFVPWLDGDPFTKLQQHDIDKGFLPPVLPPNEITDDNRSLRSMHKVPSYVIDYCPLVHLYSEERYWPYDIVEYVKNFELLTRDGEPLSIHGDNNSTLYSLTDLKREYTTKLDNGSFAKIQSEDTIMTCLDDFAQDPKWLLGVKPEYGSGRIKDAPATLIIMDKGNGWVDAFWFYFYPFNWGAFIMGYGPWGNHVGDWEHSLVRFYKGTPKYLWMSAHDGGSAYQFAAVEKIEKLRRRDGNLTPEIIKRPLIFSARGTHANYASVGQHPHDVPFFFMPLSDFTDRGPMWDPSLNFYSFSFDGHTVNAINAKAKEIGTEWLFYQGAWGDKQLPAKDPRQKWSPVQWRYINGPRGPLFKNLGRVSLCEGFKKWNFWNGCPARRFIKRGNGLSAEKNELVGDNCGILLYRIRPKWLRTIVRFIMWRGCICAIMDFFTG